MRKTSAVYHMMQTRPGERKGQVHARNGNREENQEEVVIKMTLDKEEMREEGIWSIRGVSTLD
jgi:hypothetical protein